jgi:tetratricopeptide (TPR) repeat protein
MSMRLSFLLLVALLGSTLPVAAGDIKAALSTCLASRTELGNRLLYCGAVIQTGFGSAQSRALVYAVRGRDRTSLGQHAEALADFEAGLRLSPRQAVLYRGRGDLHAVRHDLDRAIADYTVAIKLAPDDSTNWHARANAYNRKGQRALAQADRDEADRRLHKRFEPPMREPRDAKP